MKQRGQIGIGIILTIVGIVGSSVAGVYSLVSSATNELQNSLDKIGDVAIGADKQARINETNIASINGRLTRFEDKLDALLLNNGINPSRFTSKTPMIGGETEIGAIASSSKYVQ